MKKSIIDKNVIGNRIAMQINGADTVYYEYDGIYQLVKEDRRANDDSLVYINYFEYDLAGNRTHLHYVDSGTDDWTYYTYNIENQLTIEEKGGVATYYTYDPAGALLRKDVDGTVSYYEYNYDGLMDRFNEGETVATYKFDTDFRRVEKTVGETTTKYEYNGADVVAEYDGDDVLQATYNTPSIDQNIAQKRNGNIYHYCKDALGSVRDLLDSSEVIKNIYDYQAFGSIHGTPTENVINPFRFTARRWDSESLLHYYRARMYNQTLGRFISKDPIGKKGSEVFKPEDVYTYVGNKPGNLKDPLGLMEVACPSGSWGLIAGYFHIGLFLDYMKLWAAYTCLGDTLWGYVYYWANEINSGQLCMDPEEVYMTAKVSIEVTCYTWTIASIGGGIQFGTATGVCRASEFSRTDWSISFGGNFFMIVEAGVSMSPGSGGTISLGLGVAIPGDTPVKGDVCVSKVTNMYYDNYYEELIPGDKRWMGCPCIPEFVMRTDSPCGKKGY